MCIRDSISYVEVPNMQDNLEAVISVLQFIYDNIMYAELNTCLLYTSPSPSTPLPS